MIEYYHPYFRVWKPVRCSSRKELRNGFGNGVKYRCGDKIFTSYNKEFEHYLLWYDLTRERTSSTN